MERAAKCLQYDLSVKEKTMVTIVVVVASGSPIVICRLRRCYPPKKTDLTVAGGKMHPF